MDLKNLFDLSGEVAAVIGGTGSIGGLMCDALAAYGAHVVVMGRNQENGMAKVKEIQANGGKAHFQAIDAVKIESLVDARKAIEEKVGAPTILVNAAGGNKPEATLKPGDDFCKIPRGAWDTVFDLNLVGGAFLPCQVFGEAMVKAKKGNIINIASMAGMTPLSRVVAYAAAKAAVINLTQFLAREWAPANVRVNAISPGFFPAEQNRGLLFKEDGSYSDRGKQIVGHTPMNRFGDVEELAGATVWLASNKAASFVTGQNIVVDGGFSSMTI
jgi:NAD(P)-dependent dehydrogenase (short-subunit alcohol dehydrogenase family)